MLATRIGINVWSVMNDWIDAIFCVSDEQREEAEVILARGFDEWQEAEEGCDVPCGSYLCGLLDKAGIEYEVYYKGNVEED
jgi:hypothetical protein